MDDQTLDDKEINPLISPNLDSDEDGLGLDSDPLDDPVLDEDLASWN